MDTKSYNRNMRVAKGLSLRALAKLTGINYQHIRRFEIGEADLNEYQLKQLDKVLDLNNYNNDVSYQQAIELFEKFYIEVVYDTVDLAYYKHRIPEVYITINEHLVYLVMKYIIYIQENYVEGCLKIENIISQYEISNLFIYSAYMDYMGMRLFTCDQHEEALKIYKSLLKSNCEKTELGIIKYHLGFIYKDLNYFNEAMEVLLSAKEIFMDTANLKRLFGCMMLIASVELRKRNYKNAEYYYISCINLGKTLDIDKNEIAKVYRNLSWLMIRKKVYDKAQKYLEEANEFGNTHILSRLYNIWINYKLENYSEALRDITKSRYIKNEQRIVLVLDLFESLCYLENKIPSNKIISQAIKVYDFHRKTNDIDLSLFYLDILINLLERKKANDCLIIYLKEKIILLEN